MGFKNVADLAGGKISWDQNLNKNDEKFSRDFSDSEQNFFADDFEFDEFMGKFGNVDGNAVRQNGSNRKF